MLVVATSRRRGRPPIPGKPVYTSVKVDVRAHSQLKTLAYLTGRDIAEVASELILKAVEKPLAAAWANRPKPDSPPER